MAPPGQARPGELWSHEVDIAAIERDLVRLLHKPENLSPNGQPGLRTAVLNLVCFASDLATQKRIESTLTALVDHHPSRTIVIRVDSTVVNPPLDAWVQVRCKPMGSTGFNACVDQIVIQSNPNAIRRAPNAVLPLLLADLPVVLWWPGEPPLRDPLLFDLLEPATHLVVDTLGFVHVERTIINLNTLRVRPGFHVDLGDLNWDRLLPWRELIAQFWDVPAWRARLRGIDRVEIDLGKPEGGRSNRAQALLLAGWLASRLGWHPRGMTRQSDGYVLRAARGRQIVEITIKIVAGQPSGVRAIRLINDSHSGTTFSVAAGSAEDALMRVQSDAEPPSYERVARLETLPEAELLAHELDTTAPDAVYEESLGAAAAFLTMPGAGTA